MKFGPVPLDQALGAILAHSIALPEGRLRKGLRLDEAALAKLGAAGVAEVIAAQAEPDDLDEDSAAAWVADQLCGPGLTRRPAFTGRANLHADGPGVLEVDRDKIDRLNASGWDITISTLPEWQRVTEGMMVATVKVIPYMARKSDYAEALKLAKGAVALRPPVLRHADLFVTTLDGAPSGADAVHLRLARLGVRHSGRELPHATPPLAEALAASKAPLRLILTASATSDRRDVGPAALLAAGGTLHRFGMPVDPGNLLFLGQIGPAWVVGLPGCARSPALNGADWVIERLICGVPVSSADIAGMGVGGLLKEIPTRPQPRERHRTSQK